MAKFYRVQPAGLPIAGHYSETSNGNEADGLHAFPDAAGVFHLDAARSIDRVKKIYGDEVVEIEAAASWDNGDVEGVCIDPEEAAVTRRWTLEAFAVAAATAVYEDLEEALGEDAACPAACWRLNVAQTDACDLGEMP